jgi:predicted RND superfamily exporter protein
MTSMGQLLTIAIAYSLICTLIVLPALMVWLERRKRP